MLVLQISLSAGNDYSPTPNPSSLMMDPTLFPPRVCSTVVIVNDRDVEGSERFRVQLQPVSFTGNFVFAQDTATVTIIDDGQCAVHEFPYKLHMNMILLFTQTDW